MVLEEDVARERHPVIDLIDRTGSGALRVALLFGSLAIAFAMILTPLANREASRVAGGYGSIDTIATGSTRRMADGTPLSRSYTLRRSVLQDNGGLCVINSNGIRTGSC